MPLAPIGWTWRPLTASCPRCKSRIVWRKVFGRCEACKTLFARW